MTKPWEKSLSLALPDISRLLRGAEEARMAGRLAEVETLARQVLAVWPAHHEAVELLGLVAYSRGNLDRATDFLREACRSPAAEPRYFSNLAEVCRLRGLHEEAESAARRAVRMDPAFAGAWNNLGIVLQESGKLVESRECLERFLNSNPTSPEAHNNLANTLKRLDQLDDAERHWRRALELRPDYPEALSNMVVLLTEHGAYSQAEAYGVKALKLNPRLADAYLNLAALATACYNHDAALELADALLKIDPNHLRGLSSKALTLRQLDRLPDAFRTILRGVALAPDDPELQHTLGLVLESLQRLDEAEAAFERAVQLSSLQAEPAAVSHGRLLMENGRAAEARTLFEELLVEHPRSALAWSNLADLHKFTADDPRIKAMESLLAAEPAPSRSQQVLLHFALGKAYLDGGESERAFEHLNRGNASKRATLSYDSGSNVAWIRSIAQVFSPELMARLNGGGAKSALPIFVLGMPRSGTTLVEQILASHSQVQGAGELKHLHRIVRASGGYPASIRELTSGGLRAIGDQYLAAVRPLSAGRLHVVDKMPSNFLYAGLISLALPEAHIIHCKRDPIDTCLSCYTKVFADEQSFTYDMFELGAFYRAYSDLVAHWRRYLPVDRFIEVTYEDIVSDTEGQTRNLLDRLGLSWEDGCLEFYKTVRPVRTASVNQVRQPVYRSSSGRWRRHAQQLAPLLEALGVSSDARGQPPPQDDPSHA